MEAELESTKSAQASGQTSGQTSGQKRKAFSVALNRGVRVLAQREHSETELRRKLLRKGYSAVLVDEVLEYLIANDLQSNERFVESFVRSRTARGFGPVKIRQELAGRGIAESELEQVLTESGDHWIDVAKRAREKKFGDGLPSRDEDGKAWGQQARFLATRGFPADLIYRVLAM